ncbi:hypothetical protein BGX38DRAFT_1276800 [Terfezia claveryi]|nr:hypothetical protein BGX38DRAFT_1276800 [Terfezia claveryi]
MSGHADSEVELLNPFDVRLLGAPNKSGSVVLTSWIVRIQYAIQEEVFKHQAVRRVGHQYHVYLVEVCCLKACIDQDAQSQLDLEADLEEDLEADLEEDVEDHENAEDMFRASREKIKLAGPQETTHLLAGPGSAGEYGMGGPPASMKKMKSPDAQTTSQKPRATSLLQLQKSGNTDADLKGYDDEKEADRSDNEQGDYIAEEETVQYATSTLREEIVHV